MRKALAEASACVTRASVSLVWAVVLTIVSLTTHAQDASDSSRILEAVDDGKRVTLTGSTHPLARREFDRGAAPASGDLADHRIV
jgi:hypothetical protein